MFASLALSGPLATAKRSPPVHRKPLPSLIHAKNTGDASTTRPRPGDPFPTN
jgi:hypothetical protein